MQKVAVLLFLAIGLSACKPDKVDLFNFPPYQHDKKALAVFLTATWSERSGETGMSTFYSFAEDTLPGQVIPMAAHAATVGDPFYSLTASQFFSLYEGELFPSLGLNAQGFPFSNYELFVQAAKDAVLDTINEEVVPAAPSAVLAVAKRVEGRVLRAKAKALITRPIVGATLHMAIYVTENNVLGYQEGKGANIYHQYVLRGAATAGPWGELWHTGDFAVDATFEREVTFPITESMDSNQLNVVVVLYRMVDGYPVEVVNCNIL